MANIKYNNKTFTEFRSNLIEYLKNYFPNTYNDFSAGSPGMMFIELASYVGDVLSFYQDRQIQETFLQYAKNPVSLYAMAYMMGYKPKVSTASQVKLQLSQTVITPVDWANLDQINENSQVIATTGNNVSFIIPESVDFAVSSSVDTTDIIENENDTTTLVKYRNAFSAQLKETTFEVGTYQKFLTLTIDDENIIGIQEIKDSSGNTWYEVPYLAQDTILKEEESGYPKTLELEKVERRFVTRFTTNNQLQIQFGAGNNPDILNSTSDFLSTNSYGLVPTGTILTVKYYVGGGLESNVGANAINQSTGNITITNPEPATGGSEGDTLEEIRENSLKAFAENQRVVTGKDYTLRALSLPPKFGVISKAYATRENFNNNNSTLNPFDISLYVLSEDQNGNFIASSAPIKENLKKYLSQYLMLTDHVVIKDPFIVNIGVNYEIVLRPNRVANEVLLECGRVARAFFSNTNRYINESIDLNELYTLLDRVEGVQTVQNINIVNIVDNNDENYSKYKYDVKGAIKRNILYPSLDPCIFEVKNPSLDIKGRIVII